MEMKPVRRGSTVSQVPLGEPQIVFSQAAADAARRDSDLLAEAIGRPVEIEAAA
jgi:hypothetical protein